MSQGEEDANELLELSGQVSAVSNDQLQREVGNQLIRKESYLCLYPENFIPIESSFLDTGIAKITRENYNRLQISYLMMKMSGIRKLEQSS